MNIRQKILINFSGLSVAGLGITFLLIYNLFSNYRREEFHQVIKDKTTTTLKFLIEVKQIDRDILQSLDEFTINSLYKEKILIYDKDKKLIYSSIDDTKIRFPNRILQQLNENNPSIEMEEDGFDLVGILFTMRGEKYYGIAKAYDILGFSTLSYLKYMLIFFFFLLIAVILISSYFISGQISRPIINIAAELKDIDFESKNSYVSVPDSRDEIQVLASRFNELMQRLNDAFSFQKHAIHHISHELKTPIAILVTNFERMEQETDPDKLRVWINNQKEDTKNLSDIINALLEISKVETGNLVRVEELRIDELIFDVVEEIRVIHEDFTFHIDIGDSIESGQDLCIHGNERLLRLALINMVNNCIQYSNNKTGGIRIFKEPEELVLEFTNPGMVIEASERQFIFQHFFRGENSKGKRGFGLGLVMTSKIISLHKGKITYENEGGHQNIFRLHLPVSS